MRTSVALSAVVKFLRPVRSAGPVLFAALLVWSPGAGANQRKEKVLHSFCPEANCPDGAGPSASLLADSAGNLYGTTTGGGVYGGGTVFKLLPKGRLIALYSFCAKANCADGSTPSSALLADGTGNLYGTTAGGGATGHGTVFRISPKGRETVLYSFCSQPNCTDGWDTSASLIADSAGNLYGTTGFGGARNQGVVFKLTPSGREKVLYSFCSQTDCVDGENPIGALLADSAGNFYGTSASGGAQGGGTVFKLSAAGQESVLYSFCTKANCADGSGPAAALIADSAGNLYGTTSAGGTANWGVAFKLSASGHETVLHSFCSVANCADGSSPMAGLIADSAGNLYGTTFTGGNSSNWGVAFELSPAGHEAVLYSFCSRVSCADGGLSAAALIADGAGNLYGTTQAGGANSQGTVFELVAP